MISGHLGRYKRPLHPRSRRPCLPRDSDDLDDVDYAPDPSDLAAASSVGDAGDESSEEDAEGVDDDVTNLMGLDLPSRQWTAESYANARSVN